MGTIKIRGYLFPKFKFLWIGWLLVNEEEDAPLYYDNTPTMELKCNTSIKYLTFGFTQKGVLKKMKRYLERSL